MTETVDKSGSTPATDVIGRTSGGAGDNLAAKKKAKAAAPKRAAAKRTAAKSAGGTDNAKAAKAEGIKAKDRKLVWIKLKDNPDIPADGLGLSHNGVGYTVAKGEPVEVEEFLLGIIDDSRFDYDLVDAPK